MYFKNCIQNIDTLIGLRAGVGHEQFYFPNDRLVDTLSLALSLRFYCSKKLLKLKKNHTHILCTYCTLSYYKPTVTHAYSRHTDACHTKYKIVPPKLPRKYSEDNVIIFIFLISLCFEIFSNDGRDAARYSRLH